MKIQVGNREIGYQKPPFVIAEVGSNWRSLEDCMNSITQAKLAGADAVKFQLFTKKELFGDLDLPDPEGKGLLNGLRYAEAKDESKYALPVEWLPKLKEKADAVGIEFMCTAFSPEGYDIVNPYVNIHKVASAEMTHVRILEKLRSLGKPVIMSTGASGVDDIKMAIQTLGDTPKVLMYCVAAYPAQAVNLTNIEWLQKTFGGLVGYSDHSTDIFTIPFEACETWNAVVLEKHFTIIPDVDTPDRPHSLNAHQFRKMVRRFYEGLKYDGGPLPEEKPMLLKHNRRLIAIRDIKQGDSLIENENFGIYRSLKDDTHAFSPFAIDHVNGKVALKNINLGDGIGPGDI